MKFRTLTDRGTYKKRPRVYSEVLPSYTYDVDKDTGKKIVVRNGEQNVYAMKQEALKSTQIYSLIDRIERTGDMSLLGQAIEGQFDSTVLPKDLMEAKILQCKVENLYRALPVEEKAKYDNDISKFYKSVNDKIIENHKKAVEAARKSGQTPPAPSDDGGANNE